MAIATKFNFKIIEKIEGPAFVRQLKEAISIKQTWGYSYLKDTNPALSALYVSAKKLPQTQQEWVEQQTQWFTKDDIIGNSEVPLEVQENFLEVQTYLETKSLSPLSGLFLMPEMRSSAKVWWAWDEGANGRWYKRGDKLAVEGGTWAPWYHSALSTYVSRIRRSLPLYAA